MTFWDYLSKDTGEVIVIIMVLGWAISGIIDSIKGN